jgi:hypothetical protein
MKKHASFASDKAFEVKLAVHGKSFFTSEQCKALIKAINGDSEQIECAVLLHSVCVDVHNFGEALTGLQFKSSKDTIMKKCAQHQVIAPQGGGGGGGAPPSTTAYQAPQQQGYHNQAPPSSTAHRAPQQQGYHNQAPPPSSTGGYGGNPGFSQHQGHMNQAPPSHAGHQHPGMDSKSFNQLLSRVKKASFASNKLDEVNMVCSGPTVFSSEQAKALVKEVKGDSEQVTAALALYSHVLVKVFSVFVFLRL